MGKGRLPSGFTHGTQPRKADFSFLRPLSGQRGFALILALSMLAILSILGTMVLTSSQTEMSISGNYQTSQSAFYAANRAVEYASGRTVLMDPNLTSTGSPIDLTTAKDSTGTFYYKDKINCGVTGGGQMDSGTIQDLGSGPLPTKLSSAYGTDFSADYYLIDVTGGGPKGSTAKLETTIVRLYKTDADSIFRTTGDD